MRAAVVVLLVGSALAQVRPIRELRQNDSQGVPLLMGQTVTVSGVVTEAGHFGYWGPAFIEDSTGGVALHGAGISAGLSIGDSVTVTGRCTTYAALTQVESEAVESHGPVGTPVPRAFELPWVDRVDTAAGYVESEGWLVRFEKVYVAHSSGERFAGNSNYTVTDGSGNSGQLRIDQDATELVGLLIPDDTIVLVGVIGQYTWDPPYFGGYQILPRVASDLGARVEFTAIAEAIKDSDSNRIPDRLGEAVTVTGIVTAPSGVFNEQYLDIYVQDNTAGVNVFSFDYVQFELGDSVSVSGKVYQYKGKTEINEATVLWLASGRTLPEPRVLTCSQINAEPYEGELVKLVAVRTDADSLEGNENYDVTDATGTAAMRIDADTDIPGLILTPAPLDLVGIKGQYAYDTVNVNNGYQIMPRFRTDIAASVESLPFFKIAEVQRPGRDGVTPALLDSTVRVRGRVTGPARVFTTGTNKSLYIEDETQGVNVYGCDCRGAHVRFLDSLGIEFEVIGKVTEYNGLTEIAEGSMWVVDSSPSPVEPKRLPFNSALTERMESDLITVVGDVVEQPVRSGTGYNIVIKNGTPALTLRVGDNAAVDLSWVAKGRRLRVTGIAGQYDYEEPYNSGYQLMPRFNSDLVDTSGAFEPAQRLEMGEVEPSPFSPSLGQVAAVQVNAPSEYRLTVTVFDLEGRDVVELLSDGSGGFHDLRWDGTDRLGRIQPAGIYLVSLKGVRAGEVETIVKPVVIAVRRR